MRGTGIRRSGTVSGQTPRGKGDARMAEKRCTESAPGPEDISSGEGEQQNEPHGAYRWQS